MEVPPFNEYNFDGDEQWHFFRNQFTIPDEVDETAATATIKKKYYKKFVNPNYVYEQPQRKLRANAAPYNNNNNNTSYSSSHDSSTNSFSNHSNFDDDLYATMGVSRLASPEELKSQYRKLALKYHPDKVLKRNGEDPEEKFKKINAAYDILHDPAKRRMYDEHGMAAFAPSHAKATSIYVWLTVQFVIFLGEREKMKSAFSNILSFNMSGWYISIGAFSRMAYTAVGEMLEKLLFPHMQKLIKEQDGHTFTAILSELFGKVIAYPLLAVPTCFAFVPSWKYVVVAPFHIYQKNGLTALWWGLVPYMLGQLVTTVVANQVDVITQVAEEKLFPPQTTNDERNTVGRAVFNVCSFFSKVFVCALVACPLQVVSSCMQTAAYMEGGRLLLRQRGFWGIKYLWNAGGISRFFSGLSSETRSICLKSFVHA